MYFIDELPNNRIKKVNFLLPINEKDKRKNGVAILLTPNYESSKKVINHKIFTNRYYNSYYMQKSAMYYITQDKKANDVLEESTILHEYEEMLYDKDSASISYNGLSSDVSEVEKIINFRILENITDIYKCNLPKKIYVQINRGVKDKEPTNDTIYLNSKDTFDKGLFKDYKAYCKFNMYLLVLNNYNKDMNRYLYYGTALYDSGLYELCMNNWIFNKNLKVICHLIDLYRKNKSIKSYAEKIKSVNSTSKMAAKIFIEYLPKSITVSDILAVFSDFIDYIKEDYEYSYEGKESNTFILKEESNYVDFGDNYVLLYEDAANNAKIKKIIYSNRIRTSKEVLEMYKKVKEENPSIRYTYLLLEKYKSLNMFYDTSFYNDLFIKYNTLKNIKAYDIYFDFMSRMINDKNLEDNGYTKKSVIIPIRDWDFDTGKKLHMINMAINPISCLYKTMVTNPILLKKLFKDTTLLFLGDNSYFVLNFNSFDDKKDIPLFVRNIKLLRNKNYTPIEDEENVDSPKAIKVDIIDKVEKSQKVKIDNIEDTPSEKSKPSTDSKGNEDIKKELVQKVSKASSTKTNIDDTLEDLDNEEFKELISVLADDPDDGPSISSARSNRMLKLQNDLLDKKIKGTPIKDLLLDDDTLKDSDPNNSFKPVSLNIDSVNDEWKELKFAVANEKYDIDRDITGVFSSFSKMSHPLVIRDIEVINSSTSEDSLETYNVKFENEKGERYSITVDIPKLIDGKYLKLRGNRKEMPYQLFLMPIIKTDQDTVQIISCYNKIFIRRFGETSGKSMIHSGKLIKALTKHKYPNLKIVNGYNKNICSKYEVPMDYIDLSTEFSKIITKIYIFYFNQDEIRKIYKDKIDEKEGLPIGYDIRNNSIIYYTSKNGIFSYYLALLISTDMEGTDFYKNFNNASKSTRYTYSRASIMKSNLPLILICAYSEGLEKTLKKAHIEYGIYEKRQDLSEIEWDYIKYKDGYLYYKVSYDSSLLMNGLKACNTEDTSLMDINKKTTYTAYLDLFGGRIIADGLDNFYDMMIDYPITYNTLKHYNLPTDYVEVLLYANQLLADNKYIKHGDITSSRRLRREEQIANALYKVISSEYGRYCTSSKHGRTKAFSVKQSAVIDEFMRINTVGDQSIINALSEYESYNSVTPRGLSGMNSDRSYSLDKRSYDKSMLNVLSMSTGFAGNVGIVRQATIDASADGIRGYINGSTSNIKEINPVKTLCMTEALTPFGSTCDDPFRVAMNYIQTAKHGMRCKKADPLLVTTGADEALPYLLSNTFVFKSKDKGKVIELNDKYMVVEYANGKHDYIRLEERIEKNSSSGFYVGVKLDTDLKLGSTFKKDQILAYDKLSFSDEIGYSDNIAYNIGTLAKIAILNTDEGYEDSAIISNKLSEKMASEVVLLKDLSIPKNTNVYNLVKKGQKITEGDTLLILQSSFEDEDVSSLLKQLAAEDEEEITDLGRKAVKSKVTGIVQDIVITRTVDKEELSDSLKKIVNNYEKEINSIKNTMKKYGMDTSSLPSTEKLPATGKLKKLDGVRIDIYLKYEDKMSIGDKLIYYSALKGVTKDVFPEGKEPYSNFRPNEKLDSMLSVGSINGRMTMSIVKSGSLNKLMIELGRKCKDILGIKYKEEI